MLKYFLGKIAKIRFFITLLLNRALLKVYSGGGAGYSTSNFIAGKEVGQPGRIPSLVINFGDWQLHFHHWILGSAVLISILYFYMKKGRLYAFFNSFIFGFLAGLIIHGITSYSDWNDILTRKGV